jgi:putative DNA primase/helicase
MLTPNLERIPLELKALPNWVTYRPNKTPVNPLTGKNARADDPSTWGKFGQAVKQWESQKGNGIAGLGYEFSADDPFCGIDLDKCREPETGEIEAWAKAIIERELCRGVPIWPRPAHSCGWEAPPWGPAQGAN